MTQDVEYQGPLSGLNVIDFGHYYAGPMAAMLLADQGANVIRIVKPGDKELPEQQYRLLNRNKKMLPLDLKTEEGKTQALSLIEKADVVIENFRPGVMKCLGLDYASVKKTNPGLVYLSLPGFASTDKERAHLQAWEGILGAAACAYTQTSPVRQALNFPPVYTRVPQCSTYGAVYGVTAIMAALVSRQNHGCGTVIEVPLVNAGASALSLNFIGLADANPPSPSKTLTFFPDDSPETQLDKLSEATRGLVGLGSKFFTCGDGRDIYVSTYLTGQFIERFVKALGIDKQLKREGFVNVGPWESGLDNDIANTWAFSEERKQRFLQLVTEAILTRTAFEWEEAFTAVGIPAAVIRTRDEYLTLQPMLDSGVLTMLGEAKTALTVPGRLCDVSGPNNALIEHYREAESITADKAEQLFDHQTFRKAISGKHATLKKGDLLKGLKVLDLCNVIAGPTSSHILAEYGADVIKMESPDGVHPMFIPSTLELNEGKRSVVLDVKTAPGREVFQKLVRWADVVVHNCLDDVARRMGVGQDQLQAINPHVISCQLSGIGGTRRGGWEKRPSFDNLIQGLNGLLVQYGTLEYPQWHGMIASADTIGGISLAFSSLLGVYQQRTSGHAGEVRTSLIRVTNHYQLPNMIAENGQTDWGEPKGQFSLGESRWQRMYRCDDGWIYVGTTEERESHFIEIVTGQSAADEHALEAAFATQDCAHWLGRLEAAGIACHPVLKSEDLRARAQTRQVNNDAADEIADGTEELLRWDDHPCGLPLVRLALETACVGEEHSWNRLAPAPRYGEHTVEILRELGCKEEDISDLIRLKVAHEYLPGIGSKDKYFFEGEQ